MLWDYLVFSPLQALKNIALARDSNPSTHSGTQLTKETRVNRYAKW